MFFVDSNAVATGDIHNRKSGPPADSIPSWCSPCMLAVKGNKTPAICVIKRKVRRCFRLSQLNKRVAFAVRKRRRRRRKAALCPITIKEEQEEGKWKAIVWRVWDASPVAH